jgi:hypothetical protein
MKVPKLGRCALCVSMVGAMLAACESQPPIGVPGAMRQNAATFVCCLPSDFYGRGTWVDPSVPTGKGAPRYKVTGPLLYVANADLPPDSHVTIYDAAINNPSPIATITDDVTDPAGDCIDRDGTLYVANEGINSAGWISEYLLGETKASKVITKGINGPAFCAIDSQGNLWVTNLNLNNVTEYLKGSSKPHMTITNGLTYADGIAIDHAGNLYVGNLNLATGNPNVQVYPPGKKSPSRTITDGITWPVGIAVDASGTLYVTNDNAPCNVEEYRAGQSHPFQTITDKIDGPTALTFNRKGRLFESNEGQDGCQNDGPYPVILEFRPGSVEPSRKEVTNGLRYPEGLAYYPPLLP